MDRGDILDSYDMLPRRWQRRIAQLVIAAIAFAGVMVPRWHLGERAFHWLVDAEVQRITDTYSDLIQRTTQLAPTEPAPRLPAANSP